VSFVPPGTISLRGPVEHHASYILRTFHALVGKIWHAFVQRCASSFKRFIHSFQMSHLLHKPSFFSLILLHDDTPSSICVFVSFSITTASWLAPTLCCFDIKDFFSCPGGIFKLVKTCHARDRGAVQQHETTLKTTQRFLRIWINTIKEN